MDEPILSEKIRDLADSTEIDVLGFAGASEFTGYAISRSNRRDPKLSLPDAKNHHCCGYLHWWNDPSGLVGPPVWTHQPALPFRVFS